VFGHELLRRFGEMNIPDPEKQQIKQDRDGTKNATSGTGKEAQNP